MISTSGLDEHIMDSKILIEMFLLESWCSVPRSPRITTRSPQTTMRATLSVTRKITDPDILRGISMSREYFLRSFCINETALSSHSIKS